MFLLNHTSRANTVGYTGGLDAGQQCKVFALGRGHFFSQ